MNTRINFADFNEFDWEGHAGAEDFCDGSPPMMNQDSFDALVDGECWVQTILLTGCPQSGASIVVDLTHPTEERCQVWALDSFNKAMSLRIAQSMPPVLTPAWLKSYGFTCIERQ